MITRNGQPPRFRLPGTKWLTDEVGIQRFREYQQKYREAKSLQEKLYRERAWQEILNTLKREQRIWRADY